MVAAFFVATDPITHPSNAAGQWIYGLLVGVLIFTLRSFASYPDGIAFAILLANTTTAYLNRRLIPDHA
jgi:electron transport complex protein RnfD